MGTVYAVCGVSGKKDATGTFNHPAMYFSSGAYWGSMVIDVLGNTLSGKFLNDQGQVIDHFDIRKAFGPVKVEVKAFLEGPFDPVAGRMRDDLRSAGMIPTTSPYPGVFPHLGEPSAATIAPALLADTGANAIVDWVFVELRDRFVPSQVVGSKAALIQRDGDVVDMDGTSPVQFALPAESYHVALRHRNHLGVMTAEAIALAAAPNAIDLTSSSTATFGVEARKDINGVQVLWTGNVVQDKMLKYAGSGNDRDPILVRVGGFTPNNTEVIYSNEDGNLDGVVKYAGARNDRDPILVNIGGITPNNTRQERLP
ncbi:MAG: hypothetical protein IPK99_12325 [Flavobacteriales bacterium]|nr:hypothetical protein [Flavobacteriales bacterium]